MAELMLRLLPFTLMALGALPAASSGKGKKRKLEQGKRDGYYLSPNITFAGSKQEFQNEFGGFSEPMLCSGCKLTAARWSEELARRPEVNSTQGDVAWEAMLRVLNETCNSIPDPLLGVPGENGPEFASYDIVQSQDPELAEQALPNAKRSRQMAHRLCLGLMREFVRDLLLELSGALFQSGNMPQSWERFLCARKAKLCKRSEVEDGEDKSEGHVTDSVEKKHEAAAKRKQQLQFKRLISAAMANDKGKFEKLLKELHSDGVEIPMFLDSMMKAGQSHDSFLNMVGEADLPWDEEL